MLALMCGPDRTAVRLRQLRERVGAGCGASEAVARLGRLIEWSELRRAAALLHFPIQAFTLWDFHVLFAIERWRVRFGGAVGGWLAALAEIDALSVLASAAHDEPAWCMPVFQEAAPSYTARALAHPLLPAVRRVANDVEIGPPGSLLLVTGSNMSGKSTLLRAVGLNAVLAQAGAPVCAAALTMPPVELQTSIRVQDSLERGLSYFMAALAALKRVVDAAESRSPGSPVMLYLLDEVLQGTNSAERAIAVRGVVRHLLNAGAIGAMTTHDLSIAEAEPLSSAARLVHFTEQVHEDGTMTFDYHLRPGLAVSKNAIRLMQLIGIQP
jgi:DNA mismatch repair ATPase MutS